MKAIQFEDPLKEMQEGMKVVQFQDSLKEVREAMKAVRFQDPLKEWRDLKAQTIDSTLRAISREKWPVPYQDLVNGLTVNRDNTVSLDATTLSYEAIQSVANLVVDKALNRTASNIEDIVKVIVTEIRALKNPNLEKFITWVIFPIIVGCILAVINPVTDFYIKRIFICRQKAA